jgi:hypothetical protein
VVFAENKAMREMIIVTVYEPDPDLWDSDFRQRRARWRCAVAERLVDGAFLITAYPTDAIKEGVRLWPK